MALIPNIPEKEEAFNTLITFLWVYYQCYDKDSLNRKYSHEQINQNNLIQIMFSLCSSKEHKSTYHFKYLMLSVRRSSCVLNYDKSTTKEEMAVTVTELSTTIIVIPSKGACLEK